MISSSKREFILNFIALFFIGYGTFAMEYAIYRGKPSWILWFCYVGMILIGIGIIFKSARLVASQVNLLAIPLIIWVTDFWSRVLTGNHIFGTTKYFFDELLLPARVISFEHFFLVPLALVALFILRGEIKKAWVISLVEVCLIYILLHWLSLPNLNVNCVFDSCFRYVPNDVIYPFRWLAIQISMVSITHFVLILLPWFNKKN